MKLEENVSSLSQEIKSVKGAVELQEYKLSQILKTSEQIKFLIISLLIGAIFTASIKPTLQQIFMVPEDRKEIIHEEKK